MTERAKVYNPHNAKIDWLYIYHVEPKMDGIDNGHKAAIQASIESAGWVGRPLIVVEYGENNYRALTGTHRWRAARDANLKHIPAYVLTEGEYKVLEPHLDDYGDIDPDVARRLLSDSGNVALLDWLSQEDV